LGMPAFQVCHPVALGILMEGNDGSFHTSQPPR
jgi:hypothetical protein